MDPNVSWPNHLSAVIIFGVVGSISFIFAVLLFTFLLYPQIKVSYQIIKQQDEIFQDSVEPTYAPQTAVDIKKVQDIDSLKRSAGLLEDTFQYDKLIESAGQIMELAKSNTDKAIANYFFGSAYAGKKEYSLAKEYANKALELNPNYADAYNLLSMIAGSEYENEQSITYAKKAIEIDPKNAWSHNLLGIAYSYKGWSALSIQEFEEAVRLSPNTSHFQDNLRSAKAQVQGILKQ